MIPVSNDLKQATINEVMPKNMTVTFDGGDISVLNWYTQSSNEARATDATNIPANGEVEFDEAYGYLSRNGHLNIDYVSRANYVVLAFPFAIDSVTSGDTFSIRISFKRSNGSHYIADSPTYNISDFTGISVSPLNKPHIVFITIPANTSNGSFAGFDSVCGMWLRNMSNTPITCSSSYSAVMYPTMYYTNTSITYEQGVRLQTELDSTPESSAIYATPENISIYLRGGDFLPSIGNTKLISESFSFDESICSADKLKFGGCETSSIEFEAFGVSGDYINRKMKVELAIASAGSYVWDNFIVKEAKKSGSGDLMRRHFVAMDKMDYLSQNAYAWYTQYMWGVNTIRDSVYAPYLFDYPRQIFSTYWNLAKSFGIESEDYLTKQDYGFHSYVGSELTETRRMVYIDETVYDHELWFLGGNFSKSYFDDNDAFMVSIDFNTSRKSGTQYADYLENYDSIGRGIETANILLEFVIDGESDTVNYLCDSGDVILPPANWTSVYIIGVSHLSYRTNAETMANGFYIYGVKFDSLNALELVNGAERLPYYSFVWRKPSIDNIFKANSTITARDVMRSLMEMCGCFFKLTREGKPYFFYAKEHGLYPSNTLYPADDLFPKKSSEMTMPTSYYFSSNFEEYQVQKFGGVQVVVDTKDNTGAVCRWEYWGDNTSDSAYLIDDNVFLCSEQFEYEPQASGNIDTILQNLYGCLDNMQYTPFEAETVGTPFLESGDRFTLLTKNDGFESFIFERKLKGIQALTDSFEARGVAKTPRVKNFEWQKGE